MCWTRNIPESPEKIVGSLWFWFWPDGDKEPFVMEIWPDRKFSKNLKGWWYPIPINKPIEKPPGKDSKIKKTHTPIIIPN